FQRDWSSDVCSSDLRHEGRPGEAAQGARARERPAQEDRRRPGARQRDAPGALPGKLLSPAKRRRAVMRMREQFAVSERRACTVVGQARATERYVPRESDRKSTRLNSSHVKISYAV